MTAKLIFAILFFTLALCVKPPVSQAGLALLDKQGTKAKASSKAKLHVLEDRLTHQVLSDHILVQQSLLLQSEASGTAWLGLPAPKTRTLGPQDLRLTVQTEGKGSPKTINAKRLGSKDDRCHAWIAGKFRFRRGEQLRVQATWWHPHDEAQLYGYWRYAVIEPLWTISTFSDQAKNVERLTRLVPGNTYSSSQPETRNLKTDKKNTAAGHTRILRMEKSRPADDATLTVYYKRKAGALSGCGGGDPWAALDGDKTTLFKPTSCSRDSAWLDMLADCDGFGTAEPDCTRAAGPRLDIGLSVRTTDGKARFPIIVEGWFGPKRVWKKKGRSNQVISIQKTTPVTKYRLKLPKGMPTKGLGEVWLARADLTNSDEGTEKILRGGGWVKSKDSCVYALDFQNPVDIRHVTLQLKPKVPPRKEWAIYTPCSNLRSTYPFHEPFPHEHSIEKLRAAGLDTSWIKGIDKHEHGPDCDHHKAKHFRRKHPDRIELDVHPVCIETRIRVYSPRQFCTFPRLKLVY